jgi:hypothetical protein
VCIKEVIARAAHEGIAKPMEIGAIRHLFDEYVANVGLLANMLDHNSTIDKLFLSCAPVVFDVAISSGGHIVTPFEA